jgi:hypothetical protein
VSADGRAAEPRPLPPNGFRLRSGPRPTVRPVEPGASIAPPPEPPAPDPPAPEPPPAAAAPPPALPVAAPFERPAPPRAQSVRADAPRAPAGPLPAREPVAAAERPALEPQDLTPLADRIYELVVRRIEREGERLGLWR